MLHFKGILDGSCCSEQQLDLPWSQTCSLTLYINTAMKRMATRKPTVICNLLRYPFLFQSSYFKAFLGTRKNAALVKAKIEKCTKYSNED